MLVISDHGIVGISPRAVELCAKIMVVHALGIWSLSSHIKVDVGLFGVGVLITE